MKDISLLEAENFSKELGLPNQLSHFALPPRLDVWETPIIRMITRVCFQLLDSKLTPSFLSLGPDSFQKSDKDDTPLGENHSTHVHAVPSNQRVTLMEHCEDCGSSTHESPRGECPRRVGTRGSAVQRHLIPPHK